MLIGTEVGREFMWHLANLRDGVARPLDDLSGYMPVSSVGRSGFVSDSRWKLLAFPGQYGLVVPAEAIGILDLETGAVDRILQLASPSLISVLDSSDDGSCILFQAIPFADDGPTVLYILKSDEGAAHWWTPPTKGFSLAPYLPNGDWLVIAKRVETSGDRVEDDLYLVDVGATRVFPIGPGSFPIWVNPRKAGYRPSLDRRPSGDKRTPHRTKEFPQSSADDPTRQLGDRGRIGAMELRQEHVSFA